jgi:uncharacterized protein YebE (UPF0316 family)
MDSIVLLTCLGIIMARTLDVSLGTLRTVFVVQGRRSLAWFLGFWEILIWVTVASRVIQNLSEPVYLVAYALGYATGNAVGITLERWLAFGDQVVRVFTKEGPRIAAQLRSEGFRAVAFPGDDDDGPIDMLFIEVPRRKTPDVALFIRHIDPNCFYTIDDVQMVSRPSLLLHRPTGWRAVMKKK